MKRFYCTICKKVKRVREYPQGILNEYATMPVERHGECNRHFDSRRKKTVPVARRQKVGA